MDEQPQEQPKEQPQDGTTQPSQEAPSHQLPPWVSEEQVHQLEQQQEEEGVRPTTLILAALATVLAVFLLFIVFSGDDENAPPPPPVNEITVSFSADGQQDEQVQFSCPGEQEKACLALSQLPATAFEPVNPEQACTEIYGGDQQATVSGSLGGREIELQLDRSNGCQIDKYNEWTPVLVALFGESASGSVSAK